jgi:hypothetical protein
MVEKAGKAVLEVNEKQQNVWLCQHQKAEGSSNKETTEAGNTAYFAYIGIFKSKIISRSTKIQVYKH